MIQSLTNEQEMDLDSNKHEDSQNTIKNVSIITEKIVNNCELMVEACKSLQNTPEQIIAISRILPFLTNKNKEAETKIAEMFSEHVNKLMILNEENQTNYKWEEKFRVEYYCERLLNCLESAQTNVKDTLTESSIADDLCQYISVTLSDDLMNQESKLLLFKKPLGLALKNLALLLKAHAKSQEIILSQNKVNNIIQSIFKLSKTKLKERNLSILAEGVIESLTFQSDSNNKDTYSFVKGIVDKENDDRKKKALRKKKAMLAKMKKPGKMIKKKFKLDQVEQEKGITCIICQDGYQENDKDLIGVYVFVKRTNIHQDKVMNIKEENGYTTVTHFNTIHYKCHRNAYDADCNRKKPLTEWDGAQIRNSHTKCNALFPIKGGSISEDSYKQYINDYYNTLNNNIYSISTPRLRVIFNDIKNLFKKLAFEESFSKDSHGGAAEQNINLIPLMIHVSLIMAKEYEGTKQPKHIKECESFIEGSMKELNEYNDFKITEEDKKAEQEYEEDIKMEDSEKLEEEDNFDFMQKSANNRVENWMYWTFVAAILSTDKQWAEFQHSLFEIGSALAKFNAQYLIASDKIFILSPETMDKQNQTSSKSSINKYANSVKKILIFFSLVKLFRNRFISGDSKLLYQIMPNVILLI